MANPPAVRIPIYDPSLTAFLTTEVLSSADRLSLASNQYQLLQNLRRASRVLAARGSEVVISAAAPTDAIARSDGLLAPIHAQSLSLGGAWYHLSAWNTASGTAVYTLDPPSGAYTEITDKGNATHQTTFGGDGNGRTRMATQTADVTFTVVTTERRVIDGVEQPPVDILVVQNGEDFPFVWIPSLTTSPFTTVNLRGFRHLPINYPQGALNFRQVATWSAFVAVAVATGGNSYSNSTAARYFTKETTVPPYNAGTNFCIQFGATTAAVVGDTARIILPNSASFAGEQISFVVETSSAGGGSGSVNDLFVNCKLELSNDNVTYFTVYDQSSSDAALASPPQINDWETGGNRHLVTYPLRNLIPWLGLFKHIRFTRQTGAPATNYTAVILAIVGTGPGGGFEGGTDWTIAYRDRYTQAETGRIEASVAEHDLLRNVGGPSVVTSGSGTASGYQIVELTGAGILYDYQLHIVGAQGSQTIKGGLQQTLNGVLQAVPQCVDLYFRTLGELDAGADPTFWQTLDLYTAILAGSDHEWNCVFNSAGVPTPVITISTQSYGFGVSNGNLTDRSLRDPGVPAPSDFNVVLPRAAAMLTANGRTFAGQIKTPSGNYALGDVYFSKTGFPFRFTSKQDELSDGTLDESSGSRLVFSGERIQKFTTSAASYAGTTKIYVHTDQSFNTLGHAMAWAVNTLTGASDLSLRERLSSDGTLEARSVDEWNGLFMWWNQHGVLVKFEGGVVTPLSYLKFDDISANTPAARRGRMSAQIHNFRYKCGFSPSASLTNSRVMVWNTLTGVLESIDTMAAGSAERLARAFDSSQGGSGQRLFVYGSDGKVYGYEEGAGNVAVRIISREMTATQNKLGPGVGFYIDTVELAHDKVIGGAFSAACIPDFGATYTYSSALDAQSGSVQWLVEEAPDVPTTTARTVYVDYQATVAAGSVIRELAVELLTTSAENRLGS